MSAGRSFALSAIGHDRPGIVAGVSRVLLEHRLNVEDSQMTILRGHFAMTLIVAAEESIDVGRLEEALAGVRTELALDAVSLKEVTGTAAGDEPAASHIVSVYGVDHPGIVHAVSSALAERGWTITDLTTRLVGEEREPLYAMMIEVALPPEIDVAELRAAMDAVARSEGVEVTSRALEQDAF